MIRHRITVFNPTNSNDGIIKSVDSTSLTIEPSTTFIREDKYTIPDSRLIFKYISQLRIISINESLENPIFSYQYQKGLSIYVKPTNIKNEDDKAEFFNETSTFMKNIFDIDLEKDSWVLSHDSLYFYSDQKNERLANLINSQLTDEELQVATSIDYFYDDGKVVVKALGNLTDPLTITTSKEINREIGIFLAEEEISSRDDIVLSGLRVVFNQDTEEENVFRTLFHVQPRHRKIDLTYKSYLVENGLHPILAIETNRTPIAPIDDDLEECKLYYYLNLNKSLFLDKYQLAPNQTLLVNLGNSNLELPEYKIHEWGNEILLELENDSNLIELNLHSRYQEPNTEGKTRISINSPFIFYGCNSLSSELLENSPFDNRLDIGGSYEKFFTHDTVFYHFESLNDKVEVQIPSGMTDFTRVNLITSFAIILGLSHILFKLIKGFLKSNRSIQEKKNQ